MAVDQAQAPAASASGGLAASLPDSSHLTDLFSQVTDQLKGVKIPDLPLDDIKSLTGNFNLQLADTSTWKSLIPSDVSQLVSNFPDPATLRDPLHGPLATVNGAMSTDFRGHLTKLGQNLADQKPPALDSPEALVNGIFGTLGSVAAILRDPEVEALIKAVASLPGLKDVEKVPENFATVATTVGDLLRDRVGAIVVAFVHVANTMSAVERAGLLVRTATTNYTFESTNVLYQAVLNAYGEGATGLAARCRALQSSDAAQVASLEAALDSATEAWAAFLAGLARDMALTEASLAMLDTDALGREFGALTGAASQIDSSKFENVAALMRAPLERAKASVTLPDQFTIDRLRSDVATGLGLVKTAADKLDPSQLQKKIKDTTQTIEAPLARLKEFETQVDTVVRGALETTREAVRKVDLTPLRTEIDTTFKQVDTVLGQLEEALTKLRGALKAVLDQLKADLETVKNFLLDPQNGAKKKIDDVFGILDGALAKADVKGVVAEITVGLQPISGGLEKVDFGPVINSTVQALNAITTVVEGVAPLLVNDSLKAKLKQATDFLRQINFDDIGKALTEELDTILKSVDEDALGAFKAEYQKVIDAVDQLDPAPALEALKTEVFAPLEEELGKVKPAELLSPVQEAFDTAFSELQKFHPAETLSFLTEFFDELTTKLHSLNPADLLKPIEDTLDDIRKRINAVLRLDDLLNLIDKARQFVEPLLNQLQFDSILGSIEPGRLALREAIQTFDPREFIGPMSSILKDVFGPTGADIQTAGVERTIAQLHTPTDTAQLLATMKSALEGTSHELGQLDLEAWLGVLRTRHDELAAAVVTDTPDVVRFQVDLLDPANSLVPLLSKVERVKAVAAAKATSFDAAIQAAGPLVAVINKVVDALRALLSPLKTLLELVLTPLFSLFPGRTFQSPRELLIALVDALDPAELLQPLRDILASVVNKLKSLLEDTMLNSLAEVVQSVKATIDLLNINALVDGLNGVFSEIEAAVQQFNPAPIVQAIEHTYQDLLARFQQINPSDFIKEIDQIYNDDVLGVVKAIDPETLLLPDLEKIFTEVKGLVGSFDIEVLFKPILDHLRLLEKQLGDGLKQIETAYSAMLDAFDSASGGSVSVSASASAAA